jgi:hypothetical protein
MSAGRHHHQRPCDTGRIAGLTVQLSPGCSPIEADQPEHGIQHIEPPRSKEDTMLGPNQHTIHLAQQSYDQRLDHAAKIREIQRDRSDGTAQIVRAHV